MEKKYNYSRSFKTKKAAKAFVIAYLLTDYKIRNTSFKREYQGRIAISSKFTVDYNQPDYVYSAKGDTEESRRVGRS